MSKARSSYEVVEDELRAAGDDEASEAFGSALERLRKLVESGCVEGAETLAEILALQGPRHDAANAYKWYFVALHLQDYSTAFDNQRDDGFYLGPIGDFRNEAMVSELVDELGLDRVQQLDEEARAWLKEKCEILSRFLRPWQSCDGR